VEPKDPIGLLKTPFVGSFDSAYGFTQDDKRGHSNALFLVIPKRAEESCDVTSHSDALHYYPAVAFGKDFSTSVRLTPSVRRNDKVEAS
jgi:hypothetical protein